MTTPKPKRPLTSFRLLSFDCFGTLIDQEGGIFDGLAPLLSRVPASSQRSRDEVLALFQKHEGRFQAAQPDLLQSQVLAEAYGAIGQDLGVTDVTEDEKKAFGDKMGSWSAFPDTVEALNRLKKFYKLVILSNVDKASFAGTLSQGLKGVDFDAIYVAQEIGSYKPDTRNFDYMLAKVKEQFGIEKEQILQTAQSLRHDHEPAKKMGIASSWIDRYRVHGAGMGGAEQQFEGKIDIMYRFETLGAMADAVEKEAAAQ